MKELVCLVWLIVSVLGEDTRCRPGFRPTALSSHHRQDFSVTSDGQEIDTLLHGSEDSFVGGYSTSIMVRATGQRQGAMGPMSRGFAPDELCFHSKCASELFTSFVGRTPDPQPVMREGKVVGWRGTGGGVAAARKVIKNPRRFERHCVPAGGMYSRITFHLSANPRVRVSCGQIMVKGLRLRGCVDRHIDEMVNQTAPQGPVVVDTSNKK